MLKLVELKKSINKKNFYLGYLMKKKLLNVKKLKIHQIVMLKGLQLKKHFLKHWEQEYQKELTSMRL